jgi:Protein  of unknown function (DUF3018)
MGVHEKMTGAERVAKRRAALQANGLRPRQIWLPDLRNPKVRADVRADAIALAKQAHRWDDFWIDMEYLQADLWDSCPPAPVRDHDGENEDTNPT